MLTHVSFNSARSLTCCAWSGSPQPHSEEDSSSSRHCAWRSMVPELCCSGSVQCSVGHLVVRMVVDYAVPRVVHFCAPLGIPCRWSLCLESLYRKRRSSPFVRLCSAFRDRALVCSGSSCFRLGCSPAEALFVSAYDTRSRSFHRCVWLCASWSVGTSRRRHVRID